MEEINDLSILEKYGSDMTKEEFITNPAIEREEEIKKMVLALLIPDKSAILVGKPGIGKTAIVEGLAYRIQRGEIPEVLKKYRIIKLNLTSNIFIPFINTNINVNGVNYENFCIDINDTNWLNYKNELLIDYRNRLNKHLKNLNNKKK